MKTNTWQQKLHLKDSTGLALKTYEWTCHETGPYAETNTDGLVDALHDIMKICPSLHDVIENEFDDIVDTIVIDHEDWSSCGFTIEASPSDML